MRRDNSPELEAILNPAAINIHTYEWQFAARSNGDVLATALRYEAKIEDDHGGTELVEASIGTLELLEYPGDLSAMSTPPPKAPGCELGRSLPSSSPTRSFAKRASPWADRLQSPEIRRKGHERPAVLSSLNSPASSMKTGYGSVACRTLAITALEQEPLFVLHGPSLPRIPTK